MGSVWSREREDSIDETNICSSVIDDVAALNGVKRKRTSFEPECGVDKKIFKLDTPKYVYQKLFVEGYNSDIVVYSLEHKWHLHRVYLEQCNYFRALFQGNWKDSESNEYRLDLADENICITGLNNVFASLYNNEIEINTKHIAGVVAAASMLNIASILDRCEEILSMYVSDDNILLAIEIAETYGFADTLKHAFDFLQFNFWRYCLNICFLKKLKRLWLLRILSKDCLCVKENEIDVYNAVKQWIYLQEFSDVTELNDSMMDEYFNSPGYLYKKYLDVLRHIRLPQLMVWSNTISRLKRDAVIPIDIINSVMRDQWNTLLTNEESSESLDESIEDEFFYKHCFRLGRRGNSGTAKKVWRWLGCFFGMDLLLNYFAGVVVCDENTGDVLLDTGRTSALFGIDSMIEVGAFKVPPSNFSVHLFYLAFIPGRGSADYWGNNFV